MTHKMLARTLLFVNDDGKKFRYEIFTCGYKSGHPMSDSVYADSISIYVEKEVNGETSWIKVDDEISLEHLHFKIGNFQDAVRTEMSPTKHALQGIRDISTAVELCSAHWSENHS